MKKIIFTFLILLFSIHITFSIDTISTKYYPLKIGNSWTYYHYSNSSPGSYWYKNTVTSSTNTNGHIYYIIGSTQYRVDSLNGRLVAYSTSGCNWLQNEVLVDSLSAKKNDTCSSNCQTQYRTYCTDTSLYNIFGFSKPSKRFDWGAFESDGYQIYVKDFGYAYGYLTQQLSHISYNQLTGCVINGVVYGDTSLTVINPISNDIPKSFSLYQNYPNPFNPSTKIKFSIPATPLSVENGEGQGVRNVQLIIYDILGREVAILVNEKLNPGTYEVEWDASNYPSGVYFYKLTVAGFSETRKMIFIK
jgi:hypothetical protein